MSATSSQVRTIVHAIELVVAVGCRPVNAAVTGTSDSVVSIPASTKIPGRFAGMSQGVEVWDMGDFTVRVRRVAK